MTKLKKTKYLDEVIKVSIEELEGNSKIDCYRKSHSKYVANLCNLIALKKNYPLILGN